MTQELTQAESTGSGVAHPLEMLTAEEVTRAVAVLRDSGRLPEGALFASIVLHEPEKAALAAWSPGEPVERRVRAVIVPGPECGVVEAIVDVGAGIIENWDEISHVRPTLLMHEAAQAIGTIRANPEYLAALARRGITADMIDRVQIDPWPAGVFGYDCEDGRRISRCISFLRDDQSDNGYARPIEGLIVHFDNGRNEVLEVNDHGVTTMPPNRASYLAQDQPRMRTDLKPISITQSEGPSFTVEGNLVQWQKWQFRIAFDPFEGLVLHQIAYNDDDGRLRPILHRASISEMVVPYGDPDPLHGWKNAFDAGEWGLGRMTQSLQLGCDCLGEIHYVDATLATEHGKPWVIENAICMHEEDYGILWKHVDLWGGTSEVRRSRRLVVSFISTVGNYEYGFFWYFYLDGNIQLEVKLTGIVSPMAIEAGTEPGYANVIAEGIAAPHHQHLFNARLDFDVDGETNEIYEVDAERMPPGPENPWLNAFRAKSTRLETELGAIRDTDPAASRTWRIVNPEARNGLGQPTSYKLVPTMSTPTMLAHPDSSVAKRATFAQHNLWVTPYSSHERRAAGEYPNQHPGADGLPSWTANDRSVTNTDLVVWYSFGVTHFVRPEDWPVMPVEYTGFLLSPFGFFDRNPALDVPPSDGDHCHS
ncbi:MAG: primary-amine oxidase [Actinomycetota bacterium]|nr:primary-amine oxidase [Actinomycetota bacterium]